MTTPHPADLPDLPDVYPAAVATATAVLERARFAILSGQTAERIATLILGAALLELERPWRERVDELEAERESARDLAVALEGRGELAEEALRSIASGGVPARVIAQRSLDRIAEADGTAPTVRKAAEVDVDLAPDPLPEHEPAVRILGVRLGISAELVDTIGERPFQQRIAEAVMREVQFIDAAATGVRSLDDDRDRSRRIREELAEDLDDDDGPGGRPPWYAVKAGDDPAHDHEHDDRDAWTADGIRAHLISHHDGAIEDDLWALFLERPDRVHANLHAIEWPR